MDENQGTPLINPEELQQELSPEELVLPTRAQLEAKEAETAEEAVEEKVEEPTVEEAPEAEEPIYQTTLEDPGEFEPTDYSFEVTVYDTEGKNGKPVKITSVDEFEKLLDEEKNFGTASALLKAQRLATKMESGQERDKAKWEADKKAYNDQQAEVEAQNTQVNQLAAELNYLVAKGKLPKVAKQYQTADWSDPEVAKQPGIKEQIEVLEYMQKENIARRKAGLSDIGVSAALSELTMERAQEATKIAETKAGEARRLAGAKVAGVNPGPVSAAPKGVMVGRNLGDLSNLSSLM